MEQGLGDGGEVGKQDMISSSPISGLLFHLRNGAGNKYFTGNVGVMQLVFHCSKAF